MSEKNEMSQNVEEKYDEAADDDNTKSGGQSNWWNSWLETAKEKSVSMLNAVRQDITEFTSVMQCDGSRMACTIKDTFTVDKANEASEKVKKGMSTILGGISKALVILPTNDDDDECYETIQIVDGKPVVFDRAKARLQAIQIDGSTYTTPINQSEESFKQWAVSSYEQDKFDLEKFKMEISDLLANNSEVRAIYTQLVPKTVANVDFWCRYFYRKHLLDRDEEKIRMLMRRAERGNEDQGGDGGGDELDWGEEDDTAATTTTTNTTTTTTTTTTFPKTSSSSSNATPTILNYTNTVTTTTAATTAASATTTTTSTTAATDADVFTAHSAASISSTGHRKDEELFTDGNATTTKTVAATAATSATAAAAEFQSGINQFDEPAAPSSSSSSSSSQAYENKDSSDDWEKDFEKELREISEVDLPIATAATTTATTTTTTTTTDGANKDTENTDWEEW